VTKHPSDPAVVVVGAGAAGLMAALFAARLGAPTLLLERTPDGGRKILISGGGRCNVLPSALSPHQYVTDSSRNSLKRILLSWPLGDQRRFFEEDLGIALALEAESGKLFPASNRARDVRDTLVGRVLDAGAQIRFDTLVENFQPRGDGLWEISLAGGETIMAAAVVLASGGLSVQQTGSDGTGLRVAARLGHTVHDTYPALTPLTAHPAVHASLAGVSLTVSIEASTPEGRWETSGGFLFTHRGYSGPAVLNASHLAVRSRMSGGDLQPLLVRWTGMDAAAWERAFTEAGSGTVGGMLRRQLPQRLADVLLEEAGVSSDRRLPELRREERLRLVERLARYPLPWTGDEGFRKAEVTGGGVALGEVDPRTLESRIHPGLYLCGEILDAFGPIGGYNFAWAWATGRAAGSAAAAARIGSGSTG
jgi:predicted Rossmann fold flavoprotein